jgi:hypothetical protein
VDLGRVLPTDISKPLILTIRREIGPARWDSITCAVAGNGLRAKISRITPDRWLARLRFADVKIIGPRSFRLQFSFQNHGRELKYHQSEPVDADVAGPVSLVPESLLIGVVKAGNTFRHGISLWPADNTASGGRIISAISDDPSHFRIKVLDGGKKATALFYSGRLHGRVSGSAEVTIVFNGVRYHASENYLAFVVGKQGTK